MNTKKNTPGSSANENEARKLKITHEGKVYDENNNLLGIADSFNKKTGVLTYVKKKE